MKNHFIKGLFLKNIIVCMFLFTSCSAESNESKVEVVIPPADSPFIFGKKPTTGKEVYIPIELKQNDFNSKSSKWCYQRSASSENIIVFWEAGFGDDPTVTQKESMRVNLKDFIEKAEKFYAYYRDEMKFVQKGKSKTDQYRMIVMLIYQDEWLATGAGYDNVIGALWVNPTTCNPVGNVIAHEFGHSFQYQVNCDGGYGFRDQNYVGSFWEQCAQYMSWQLYPAEFTRELPYFLKNVHKNFSHEDIRYQSMYLMEYWKQKHGKDFLGRVWKEAIKPEHPIEAYKRITKITQEQFNDEVFEYACKNITWDYPLGENNNNFINALPKSQQEEYKHKTSLTAVNDGYFQISLEQIPQSYGYNAIKLKVPAAGTNVSVTFEGLDNNWKTIAGWRWGFVTVNSQNKAVYETIQRDAKGSASILIKEDSKELWLVVTGAPTEHVNHVWDDNNANDENFPYKLKFENTNPL
ncbi:DUF6055 domain-containing protein [Flavobacterium aquicola]|uniref:DUF4859 domain-containing protein n=1 Tax=Flavobacterium aquicola TaxID=1682742 RepID=A0A3E0ERT2_9FLAO|nr:DUF6055 domain-containing protein [Flavobacterium aquicola]REH00938.1 hypothetical protein C8P67_102191 [Flavobacterium aquicola]